MTLPRAIQKQIKEANELVKQMSEAEGQPQDEPEGQPPQEAQPPKQEAQPPKQEAQPPKQEAQPPKQEAQPPAEPDWQQRYKVLQGKYNAEVPRLTSELRQVTQERDALRAQMTQQKPQRQDDDVVITDEEVADYGEDFMDLVGRKAKQIARAEVSQLQGTIAQLQAQLQNVGQTVTKTGRQAVLEKLDSEVENWREQNHDPEFLSWLNERDIYSGVSRKQMFDEALERNDADRVVAFFKGYLREHATTSKQESGKPPSSDTSKTKLDALVAPGKPRGAPQQTGARDEMQMYDEREYTQAHNQYLRGKMSKDDWNAFEKDFLRAVAEGRVVPANRTPVSNAAL